MKVTKSKLREIIREVIREADESDKYSHIGYGKYKEKGKEKDKDAETFKKTDSGKFEPFGDKEGGEKEKPEPKHTKIAADPFADKDSETGKDYTRKFMGTDEPDDWYDDSETAYQSGEDPVHKIATDVYYINKYEGGGDSFEQEAVPAYKISNIEDMLAADSGNQLYISKGEEGYFDGKSFTSEKGSTTTLEPDHVKGDDDEADWSEDDPRWDVPPKPDDLKDFLDGFGKTDVYSDGEVSNEMMGEFDFEDNKVTYSNSNFEELDDWNLAKDVLGPLKKAGIKYKKYKDEYSAGVIVNTEDLEGLTDVLKQTVGNKDGGGDAGEEKEKPKPWKSWEYKPGMGMEINPDELTGVDYNQKEMEEWVDNQRTRGVLATASRDTLAKIAKYDPKANPRDIMNSRPGGFLVWDIAKGKDVEADTIPLYKEIEYMAKASDRQPEKMKDLFRRSSTGAKEYWYVQLGLRRPEDLSPDRTFVEPDDEDVDDWDVHHKSGDKYYDTAPPSFKESITSQLKKEFKQYGFTQKSKNWKRIMI